LLCRRVQRVGGRRVCRWRLLYMNVLYVASEIAPFASTGGLADVGAGLPKALQSSGIQVMRIMPYYRTPEISDAAVIDENVDLDIVIGDRRVTGHLYRHKYASPKTFFIRQDRYFFRDGLYGTSGTDYSDNFERFLFFQKAVVASMPHLGDDVHVVHCNDWQTSLIPLLLHEKVARRVGSVFTIHNLAFQGVFDRSMYPMTNLAERYYSIDCMEYYGQINLMKAALVTADILTTVSPSYARDIQTPEHGCGLDGVLRQRSDELVGIINGVDYDEWDPSNDTFISHNYCVDDLRGKSQCKRDLLRDVGLEFRPRTPVLGIISRLAEQKGIDLIDAAIHKIVGLGVILVVLGTGENKYEAMCRQWASRWPANVSAHIRFDRELSHKIEAGADIFLMPSRFEPCGLNQLYSLRYGTLPVAHATGGLKDTIRDISDKENADGTSGTGFLFKPHTSEAMTSALLRATSLYGSRRRWLRLVRGAMRDDFSWCRSAAEYALVYRRAMAASGRVIC